MAGETDEFGRPAIKLTTGNKVTRLRVPCQVHCGGYRQGPDYLKGDTVSHQRSQFVCLRDHPTGRPGDASGHWVLTVMHGRDGKDGKDARRRTRTRA